MKPKKTENSGNLFLSRLDQIIDLRHELVQVAGKLDWSGLEKEFGSLYDEGMGRPGLPTRLMVGLHYLKYTFNESDESVVARWVENPYWQYFCGYEYFQHDFPLDPSSLVRWRHRIGEGGAETLLQKTIEVAVSGKLLKTHEARVNVDTTVQEKAIAYPTDSALYEKARSALVKESRQLGVPLRQSYVRVGKRAQLRQGRYRHARRPKQAQKETKKLQTYLGRVIRDIQRKCPSPPQKLADLLETAQRIYRQKRNDRNKTYSVHAPEVECIAKGKSARPYEFGCKASFTSDAKTNFILGAKVFHGNPYDGHTLEASLEQVRRLTGALPEKASCDRGYRGVKLPPEMAGTQIRISGQKGLSPSEQKWLKKRSAIEPVIGHLKADHRLARNPLLRKIGDQVNAILAACGFNLKKLLRAFLRLFFPAIGILFLAIFPQKISEPISSFA